MTAPSLLTIARRALTGEAALERGATLLVAVSGGPDSMALLHVAATLAPKLALVVRAHGVDHGLRAEAPAELDAAAAFADSLDVRFERTVVAVARGGNLQARARQARYEALASAAARAGARAIATAHHADDRAETFLLRLLRGAGPAGLGVLPPRAPLPFAAPAGSRGARDLELLRPLLRARRADVRAHVERHAIPFAEDPSNDDPRFARARVRRELLPLLVELSPGIVSHLEALADQLHAAASGEGPALPRATQRALKELLRSPPARGGPGAGRSAPGPDAARVWLPGGLVVTRERAEKPGRRAARTERETEPEARAPRPSDARSERDRRTGPKTT
jgi:tRNA(Ile)-lysidine synthase